MPSCWSRRGSLRWEASAGPAIQAPKDYEKGRFLLKIWPKRAVIDSETGVFWRPSLLIDIHTRLLSCLFVMYCGVMREEGPGFEGGGGGYLMVRTGEMSDILIGFPQVENRNLSSDCATGKGINRQNRTRTSDPAADQEQRLGWKDAGVSCFLRGLSIQDVSAGSLAMQIQTARTYFSMMARNAASCSAGKGFLFSWSSQTTCTVSPSAKSLGSSPSGPLRRMR